MKKGFMKAVCLIVLVGLGDVVVSGREKLKVWDEQVPGGRDEGLVVMFWNVENFFDWTDEGMNEGEKEFSASGSRRWTKKRFYVKCDAVAKAIMWVGDRYGRMPDVIGLAEVENKGVLAKLLDGTVLRKYGYGIVHHESGDRRGIDVALLYRKSSMAQLSSSVRTPLYMGKKMETRDILHTRMRLADGREIHFIVNHHPSKFGGDKESEGRRAAAMTALKEVCDSLARCGRNKGDSSAGTIVMGDFNDVPDADSFSIVGGTLVNKGTELHQRNEGTIRYEGRWDLIDMFMVSEPLSEHTCMEVCRIPFLMVWEKKHPGYKPLRTYSGPRYIGGVSDHCPIVLKMDF